MKNKIMRLILRIVLLGGILPSFTHATEQRAWPIITFICDKAKKEVKIKNEVKWGIKGRRFPFSEKLGTYNPWELVSITDKDNYRLVAEKSALKLKCELGKAEYTFVVKPKIFNPNFDGKCGDRLSVNVSIYNNSSALLEDKDMEGFCHGNTPVLRGIKVFAKNNKVKLYEVSRSRFY